MQTFSQYAATRLLREHSARTLTFGGVAVKAGTIQTFAGVDLITGMPVLIYTLPERPPPIPEVYSEFIPGILETGFEREIGYVVASSAPGYAPLKPTLSRPRLEWLTRVSAQAMSDAHGVNLIHGNLEPAHFLVSGDHLMLEGWGLPWGEAHADYRAPEGGTSAAADVFAWARSLQNLGRGNARVMLEGELGRWIAHGLNPKPQDRPTAQEMLMAVEKLLNRDAKPTAPQIITATEQNLRALEETLARELPPLPETPITLEPSMALQPEVVLPAPLEETSESLPERDEPGEPRVGGVELPVFATEPAVLHEPEHLAADEPDVQPKPVRETDLDPEAPEPGLLVRREPTPIRIGFEEDDDSWRQVVQPGTNNLTGRPWIPALLAALAIACLIGLVLLLRPTTTTNPATVTPLEVPGDPVAGSVVNFKLSPDTGLQGRLVVLSAPTAAQLEVNSVLATVPGPVLFNTPGTYRLRVNVDGYKPGEFEVSVPGQTEIVLELRQR